MKASLWSTRPAPPAETEVKFQIIGIGERVVRFEFRRRNRDGRWSRLTVCMSPDEARELAYSILPAEPKFVPKL